MIGLKFNAEMGECDLKCVDFKSKYSFQIEYRPKLYEKLDKTLIDGKNYKNVWQKGCKCQKTIQKLNESQNPLKRT